MSTGKEVSMPAGDYSAQTCLLFLFLGGCFTLAIAITAVGVIYGLRCFVFSLLNFKLERIVYRFCQRLNGIGISRRLISRNSERSHARS